MGETFNAHSFLIALGEQLAASGAGSYDLAICGGSALNVLGLVIRTTRDIDVFALVEHGRLVPCPVMPKDLAEAASRVAKDFSLPPDWINVQAATLHPERLPEGLKSRWVRRNYGTHLAAHFIGRLDQIHFKLHAAADRGDRATVHFVDLQRLTPSPEEIRMAARWARETQDPSEGFKIGLRECIRALGFKDVAEEF